MVAKLRGDFTSLGDNWTKTSLSQSFLVPDLRVSQ